ncbi:MULTISPECIES: hypothetical protein [Serratia]|uniref:hypothetical protein n=1 Tax=Serratia TaxID=613 RepID=UPI0021550F90|nr:MULTISPECIES: hypothetical protein [Serratia]MDI9109967.1 hypothetical protein [Serratia marcescens]MDR8492601.1 hypothetical protein [Serratia nevei]MDR8536115.1 hypothetical protein [Serratia nevei]BEM63658.1 hypothetical protein SME23J_26850 [Serratia marcescens]
MFSSLKLLYIADDIISPDEFPRIVSPSRACHGLSYMPDKDILSLFSGFRGGERIRREVGVTQNGISSNLRARVQSDLMSGVVVAVETRPGVLATMGPFYADNNESDYELIKNALPDSLQKPWGVALPFTLKEWSSLALPDAAGIPHTLAGGAGTLLDKHGIDQTITLIEDQKDEDVATIRGRI